MARAPKFNMPASRDHGSAADAYAGKQRNSLKPTCDGCFASDWKPGHRAPGEVQNPDLEAMGLGPYGGFYGQLDGVAYGDDPMDKVSAREQECFPDCDSGDM